MKMFKSSTVLFSHFLSLFIILSSAAITQPRLLLRDDNFEKSLTEKCDLAEGQNLNVSRTRIIIHNVKKGVAKKVLLEGASRKLKIKKDCDFKYRVVVIIPGYPKERDDNPAELVRAYMAADHTYIMVLDTSEYTKIDEDNVYPYPKSVKHVRKFGKVLAQFLSDITRDGVPLKNIHVIGMSLGAHIGGFAGKEFRRQTGKTLSRITGLDPAGPCFDAAPRDKQLNSDDAEFVDIYHTNKGQYGSSSSYGTVDFYPNGGGPDQPECQSDIDIDLCSHLVSTKLWVETILRPGSIYGRSCESWDKFNAGKCKKNRRSVVGDGATKSARGKYFFDFEGQSGATPDCQSGGIWIIPTSVMILQIDNLLS